MIKPMPLIVDHWLLLSYSIVYLDHLVVISGIFFQSSDEHAGTISEEIVFKSGH